MGREDELKYLVTYEIDSTDLNAATAWAHEMLYMADLEADSVTVEAQKPAKSGYTFAGGTPGFPEVSPRVAGKLLEDALGGSKIAQAGLRDIIERAPTYPGYTV